MLRKIALPQFAKVRTAARDDEPLDARARRSRAKVLEVTAELLFERGFGGASVDEITRRSGVAKTTIYRHWPTRTDLLRDACSKIGTPQEIPDTGNLQGDLQALVTDLAFLLRTQKWTAVLPSVIDAAERSPDIADMYSGLQAGYVAPFKTVFERAIRRAELPKDADTALLVAELIGPLFYRRWFSREPLTDDFAKGVAERVIGAGRRKRASTKSTLR